MARALDWIYFWDVCWGSYLLCVCMKNDEPEFMIQRRKYNSGRADWEDWVDFEPADTIDDARRAAKIAVNGVGHNYMVRICVKTYENVTPTV